MNRFEKLINEFCPDGVKKEKLKNLAEIGTGNSNRQDATEDGQYTFFVRSKDTLKSSSYEYDEEAIIIPGEGGIGEVFHYINDKYALHQRAYRIHVVSDLLDTKFLYHYMKSAFKKFITKKAVSATVTSIRKPMIEDFEVPLPPLSIQSEIVHILDSFTLLTAELTARQKQYAFYRDYLLDFSDEDVAKKIPDIDCSNVEYKRLGDIANIIRGGNFQKKDFVEQGKPCIHYGQIYTRLGTTTLHAITYLNDDVYNKSKKAISNDIVMAVTSENIEDVCKCTVWLGNEDAAVSGHTAIIHPLINSKYLAYYFQTTMFFKQKRKLAHGTKVIEVTPDKLNDIPIPVPPLSVQENIVKILDRFDKLNNDMSEGLPAEIEARKKQYEYYRDTLLSFDDKACSQIVKVERERELSRIKAVKWLKLSDVSLKITDGMHNLPKDVLPIGDYPIISAQNVNNGLITTTTNKYVNEATFVSENKRTNLTNGDVLITIVGAIGRIAIVENDLKALCQRSLCVIKPNYSIICSKYLKFVLESTPVQNYIIKNAHGAAQKGLYLKQVSDICIPVPSLEEQERIVSILDRFDKLCNDISEGLPAEIEARQKQYEYYRDKLLTFKMRNA